MSDLKAEQLNSQLAQIIKNNNSDIAYNVVKAGINFLPAPAGSLISYLIETYFKSPADKRSVAFLFNVIEAIKEIEYKVESFSPDSPIFETALLSALDIAKRHHQEQELEALRNAVLNAAMLTAPEADIQRIFLNWLDGFTSRHLILLKYLHEGTYSDLQPVRDDLEVNRPFYNHILQDLNAKGLIQLKKKSVVKKKNEEYENQFGGPIPLGGPIPSQYLGYKPPYLDTNLVPFEIVENIDGIVRESELYHQSDNQGSKTKRVTDMGKLFLDFIKNPLEKVNFDRYQQ